LRDRVFWRIILVKVVCKSIVDDELLAHADAVVNATNPYMIYGSGICGQFSKNQKICRRDKIFGVVIK